MKTNNTTQGGPMGTLTTLPTQTTWGPWTLNRERLELELIVDGWPLYEVDLERCPTAAAVLDWIAQVQGKGWATPALVGHLIAALCDLLEPQARLCSWGMSNEVPDESTEEVRERILDAERKARAWRLAGVTGREDRLAMLLDEFAEVQRTHWQRVRGRRPGR
jgi:hypothetical protein